MKECCKPAPERYVPYFPGWTAFTPTIPAAYWQTYSQEQRILCISKLIDKIACYLDMLGDKVSDNREDINWLLSEFVEFKEHGFDDYYAVQVAQWIADNLEYIYDHTIKMVWFGLNQEGYFVAYIPESWDAIHFQTGFDYDTNEYGRLILWWDVDNAGTADQTPDDNHLGIE